jgi:glycosyltransferase 2 family protein
MNKKRVVTCSAVLVILSCLVCVQFRQWRNFDWSRFLSDAHAMSGRHVVYALILGYLAYFLRAVRWKLFLRPMRSDVSTLNLISPTVIGFTALALLGRPGELVRPYLIARRTNLSVASQLGVWTVERIFDIAAFTVLIVSAIFLPTELREFVLSRPDIFLWFHVTGYVLLALVLVLFLSALLMKSKGHTLAGSVEDGFSLFTANFGRRVAQRIREFAAGLNAIHSPVYLVLIWTVSVFMWWCIALTYSEVTHAYGAPMQNMSVTRVLLLVGSSMLGSMLQLPGVGGGTQLATIEVLAKIYNVPNELAVSCGILLWLVTFVAIVPVGLLLARQEQVSLRKLVEKTEHAEKTAC